MRYCPGHACPLRAACYHHTQPSPGWDAFGALPYDAATESCAWFHSNVPGEAQTRETAYSLWLRNGCPEHQALAHWSEAYLSLCRSTGRSVSVRG